jgi:hypothetical protein
VDTKWIRFLSILEQCIPELVSHEALIRSLASFTGMCDWMFYCRRHPSTVMRID